jgi:hypothetical protein
MSIHRFITLSSPTFAHAQYSPPVLNVAFALLLGVSGTATAQEELDGPGLFSGEKGEFSLGSMFSEKETAQTEGQQKAGNANDKPENNVAHGSCTPTHKNSVAQANTQTTVNQDEFALFKAWKKAKAESSPAYQEFLIWLEFQDYKHKKSD